MKYVILPEKGKIENVNTMPIDIKNFWRENSNGLLVSKFHLDIFNGLDMHRIKKRDSCKYMVLIYSAMLCVNYPFARNRVVFVVPNS